MLDELDVRDAILVGFSMGTGEVAAYCARKGTERLRSVVFAAPVTPYMLNTSDNPEGPLSKAQAAQMAAALTTNQDAFYREMMMTGVFSANGVLTIPEDLLQQVLDMRAQAGKHAARACMASFSNTELSRGPAEGHGARARHPR